MSSFINVGAPLVAYFDSLIHCRTWDVLTRFLNVQSPTIEPHLIRLIVSEMIARIPKISKISQLVLTFYGTNKRADIQSGLNGRINPITITNILKKQLHTPSMPISIILLQTILIAQ